MRFCGRSAICNRTGLGQKMALNLGLMAGLICFTSAGLDLPASAQYRTAVDDLRLQAVRSQHLQVSGKESVEVRFSTLSVESALLHYLKLTQGQEWELTFPTGLEAEAWLKALENTPDKVFMLNLYHKQSKVNYSLTIGKLSLASHPQARSIITIYKMRRPFGRRGG